MNDSVHIRNAKALDARSKQLTAEVDALRIRVVHLENQLAMQGQTMRDLQQNITVIFASRGRGPTVVPA